LEGLCQLMFKFAFVIDGENAENRNADSAISPHVLKTHRNLLSLAIFARIRALCNTYVYFIAVTSVKWFAVARKQGLDVS